MKQNSWNAQRGRNILISFFMTVVLVLAGFLGYPGAAAAAGEAPAISGAQVTDLSASGYTVTATFSAPAGLSRVLMPTWTEANGQDDLIWHTANVSGNTATFRVPVTDHRNESGHYHTHIYVYDSQGRYALTGLDIEVPASQAAAAPTIISAQATDLSASGYTVTATFSAPAGLSRVLMPTWTDANGQDDLTWYTANVSGNTAAFRVPVTDHRNESGHYHTHIYVYDSQGRYALTGLDIEVPASQAAAAPAIISAQATDLSASGYTVTATFSAPAGLSRVLMPTWTDANGQDDLTWYTANVSGNTATFRVPVTDHRNESGHYHTHIYVYDSKGRYALTGLDIQVPGGGSSGSGHIVCIDAGHQAYGISTPEPIGPGSSVTKAKLTSGTTGVATGVAERDLNLAIALQLKAELIRRGYQVVMIRETNNCTLSNAERAQVANASGAEIFLRLHGNGNNNHSVSGAQMMIPSTSNPYLSQNVIAGSTNLANHLMASYCAATGCANRGILTTDTMTGINWCRIPVVIVEMGFMTNPTEDVLMQTPSYQAKMVAGLANGVDSYFGK